ncbi:MULTISPECIES: hypothetical protein [unclassified Ruegeria]|nr:MULTISPECIES: hypothetical protein [unclassified Ruegeria]
MEKFLCDLWWTQSGGQYIQPRPIRLLRCIAGNIDIYKDRPE